MIKEDEEFLEECKKEVKLISKETMIQEFSTACADVMAFMGDKLNKKIAERLILALTFSSGRTIKRLFKEDKDMTNYSEREDV